MSGAKGLPPEILAALQDFESTKRGTKTRMYARGRLYGVIGTAISTRDAEIAAEAAKLVADLSDALTDEGPDWTEEGLHKLRCRVAAMVPLDQLPDWLHRYARQEPQPSSCVASPLCAGCDGHGVPIATRDGGTVYSQCSRRQEPQP